MKRQKKNQPAKTATRQERPAPVAEGEATESPEGDLVGGAVKGALVGGLLGGGGGAAAGGAAGLIGSVLGDDEKSGW
ncbi:hypothetical protein WMF20_29170 [Sorangium sp. So ce834]|uniref:hypothetical protein n=1 Tax=Sorangium sp. So ce834 TaxID=3133321 RepID=UPI003F5D9284